MSVWKSSFEFISAADIYITPYLNAAQITSGTLAYTLGAGKAVISTPYWYAEEMLAEGRGVLVPFRDPAALADQVIDLLDNEAQRHAMRKRAYVFGREMIWPQVASRYMESFERARAERRHFAHPDFAVKPLDKRPGELPPLKLDHLRHMTDETGILQHAIFTIPNYREGYTTDDNARALMVSALLEALGNEEALELASRYLAFIWYAFNTETGRFRNFMDYQRHWLEVGGSDDSHGRTLWALGTVLGRSNTPALQSMAGRVFEQALPAILDTTSPRAWAFALIGIHEYLQRFAGDRRASQVREELSGRLLTLYQSHRSDEWRWYRRQADLLQRRAAACLAHVRPIDTECRHDRSRTGGALLAGRPAARGAAGHFVPIGSNGFYPQGGERARFDQQPVEAQAMVSACLEAYRITGDKRWRKEARRAFEWFLGRNDLNLPVYDPTTGGCRDGLHPDRLNENQGAESTLAFLQALLELRLAENVLISTGGTKPMNNQHPELFHRHERNPILTAADWPYPVNSVFNPGATLLPDGTTLLLCRVEDRRGHSHLCAARSANGVDGWQIDPQPTLLADPEHFPEELWGIEDPRITYVPELSQYAVVLHRLHAGRPGRGSGAHRRFPPLRALWFDHAAGR